MRLLRRVPLLCFTMAILLGIFSIAAATPDDGLPTDNSRIVVAGDSWPANARLTTKGMLIDAGSGGSRLHIYNWAPRVFKTVPPPISYPTTDEKFTGRIDPGIAQIAEYPDEMRVRVAAHLAPLIDFAKTVLAGDERLFGLYPIYFKATGGMREVALKEREQIMYWVRILLSDKSFCPFFFRPEMARVISGEEEAIFSWTAMNFLFGNLLQDSQGLGQALTGANATYGTLDLGGSSTQIAFFVPNQDISEGLYKLQIGGQKHWNVYTKSFLQFGVVSARRRHLMMVADAAAADKGKHKSSMSYAKFEPDSLRMPLSDQFPTEQPTTGPTSPPVSASLTAVDPCFHSGYTERVASSIPSIVVDISGPETATQKQLSTCMESLRPLMEKDANAYCNVVYHGECSIGGSYQPALPSGPNGRFVGTSSYKFSWELLQLPATASLDMFEDRATNICSLSIDGVHSYLETNPNITMMDPKLIEMSQYFCFLTAYTLVLLKDGYGFTGSHLLTVVDTVNGNKAGWALGAILHEINALPWELEIQSAGEPWGKLFLASTIGLLVGAFVAFSIARELMTEVEPLTSRSGKRASKAVDQLRSLGSVRVENFKSTNSHYPSPMRVDAEIGSMEAILTPTRTSYQQAYAVSSYGSIDERRLSYTPPMGGSTESPQKHSHEHITQYLNPFGSRGL